MTPRWKIAIAVSLVLNLFLIGSLVGVIIVGLKMADERAEVRRGRGHDIGAALQALPDERRRAFREVMRARALSAAPDFRAAGEARREATQLMAAQTYDAAAVSAALARARAAEARARARIDATLATRLSEFSAEERKLFAQVMMRGPGGRGRRDRGPGDHRPDGPPPPLPPPEPPEAPPPPEAPAPPLK
ncbi:MAG: hypothetical protein B7Y99_09620 [Caulobacterales bacterium 32-69-10]|nr:MAG: hypothetical protein B7Y99_09620 [Caulobacterales bacterium 32-69-10]